MVKKESFTSCNICGKPGIEKPSETLPDKGTLIKVLHEDGKICEFVEYDSVATFLDRTTKKKNPKTMECPACGSTGMITGYRPYMKKRYHRWRYYITHERLEGYWGKKRKVQKYRRCYMKTEEEKNKVLERLRNLNSKLK